MDICSHKQLKSHICTIKWSVLNHNQSRGCTYAAWIQNGEIMEYVWAADAIVLQRECNRFDQRVDLLLDWQSKKQKREHELLLYTKQRKLQLGLFYKIMCKTKPDSNWHETRITSSLEVLYNEQRKNYSSNYLTKSVAKPNLMQQQPCHASPSQ